MSEITQFDNLHDLDNRVAEEIGKYLDTHFYPKFFSHPNRIEDSEEQLNGKDIVASSKDLGLTEAIIDEKSASHYVNKNLPTFAFEISFRRRDNLVVPGWFVDENKTTDYYLVIWPLANPDRIQKFTFDGKEYPFFTCEDITRLDYVLVKRSALRELVEKRGYNNKWLGITAWKIRNNSADWLKDFNKKYRPIRGVYFQHSVGLKESPVNLIVPRKELESIAILKGSC